MFSPYYVMARRHGRHDPENHCAINVALYGVGGPSWSCTERGRSRLDRTATCLSIGPSSATWRGNTLEFRLDEVTTPLPRRLRGVVRVEPRAIAPHVFDLDEAGRHRWRPISPCARVEVVLDSPELRWSGEGYLDSNDGDEPLDAAFTDWHWSRASLRDGTAVNYEVTRRTGEQAAVALRFDKAGRVTEEDPPPTATLARSRWGVRRATRADVGANPSVRQTLEDGPFYARSVLDTGLYGERAIAVHETVSLDRFRKGWVQAMLPFRMPRAIG